MDRSSLSSAHHPLNVHIALILLSLPLRILLGATAVNSGGRAPRSSSGLCIIWSHPIAQPSAVAAAILRWLIGNESLRISALTIISFSLFLLGGFRHPRMPSWFQFASYSSIARYRFAVVWSLTAGPVWNGVTAWRETGWAWEGAGGMYARCSTVCAGRPTGVFFSYAGISTLQRTM
jgi:hypothetical protein